MQQDPGVNLLPFKYKHLPLLIEMLKKREYFDVSVANAKNLPKIGYIAVLNNEPIAAGFLRKVEGGYAQLDGLTSNPYFGSQIRHIGITKVVNTLLDDAKRLKLRGVIALTADIAVIKRAEAIGFQVLSEQSLLSIRI